MKQHWTHIELVKYWTLSQDEIRVINTKSNKLIYSIKMKYFDINGLMLTASDLVPSVVINFIKEQINICKYLISEDLRKEIDEALNVIENWHSGNKFIFFGRRGISSDEIDHELSILSLHLVQSSLVYINTLLLQQVIKEEQFEELLTLEDKRAITPLFYHHVSQYGLYHLDMNERIPIEV